MHPLFELEDDLFTMGSKDLNMIRHIPQMIQSGVESFKIEGRMKSIHYVSTVVNAYRKAIDAYCQNPDEYEVKQEWIDEIEKAANRPLSSGFFFKSPSHDDHIYKEETKITSYDFAGLVVSYDESEQIAVVQQRNHFKVGQEIEFFGPHGTSFQQTIDAIWDTEGNSLTAARHPMQEIRMKVHFPVRAQDMMRKKVE
jgi:putative protease